MITTPYMRELSQPNKFGTRVPVEKWRIDWLRDQIAAGTLPARLLKKWNVVLSRPASHTVNGPISPWEIPENYSEEQESNAEILARLRSDTEPAVDYAWRYLVNGAASDAAQTVKILAAYSTITVFENNAGSLLNWYDGWGLLTQAAMMVKDSAAYTATVHNNFRAATLRALNALDEIAFTRQNNWAAWGLAAEMQLAGFLNDRLRFDRALFRWRQLFDDTIKSGIVLQGAVRNNIPVEEIYRMGAGHGNGAYGLLYSNFHLAGMAAAAEYARQNGEWLFDHVSPDGSSLKGFYEQCVYWTKNPTFEVLWFNTSDEEDPSHPYYRSGAYTNRILLYVDILGALWPNSDVQTLMNNYDIVQDYYSFRGAELAYRGRPLV